MPTIPSKNAEWNWRKLGISNFTYMDYARLFDQQQGVCAICGGTNSHGRALSVDHDHATGLARGLLCQRCNILLPGLEQPPGWIEKAQAYLEDPPAQK